MSASGSVAMVPLPIDPRVPEIAARVRERRAAVVIAPPGAGKTTRVPPALVDDGPVIVLQPRRIAARSLAKRIADERGWTVGEEVGWHVRFERRFTAKTKLLVATEGILTARLQSDPLLTGFRTIVLDEFHERSIHADLALALANQAMRARDDLRIVVMSATLDAVPVARFLGECPVIEIDARAHPVTVAHEPHLGVREAVRACLARDGGHVLVFLPGAPEIRRAASELGGIGAPVFPLHGSLSADEQDAAIAPSKERRVILATNIAETSLTVEGVTDVVDTGLQKVLRWDPAVGLDRLETERIALDSADQRAGRAGRTAPGRAMRLWDARQELAPHREPEIRRIDLAGPMLEIFAWGADPRGFEWFEAPPPDAAERALALLEDLGAVRDGKITPTGRRMHALALHPRLARVMVATGASREAAAACAILSEGLRWAESRPEVDLLDRVARISEAPPPVRRAAEEIERQARALRGAEPGGEHSLRRALFEGYADRLARRRAPGSNRFLLASGYGATLARDGHFPPEEEWLVALDLVAARRGEAEGTIRLATAVDREWIEPTATERVLRFDPASRSVRASVVERNHALVLKERPATPEREEAAEIVAGIVASILGKLETGQPLDPDELALYDARVLEDAAAWMRRARFAGVSLDLEEAARSMTAGRAALPALDLRDATPWELRREIEAKAPSSVTIPSGRNAALDYRANDSVFLSVKLQELFGLAESPRIGPNRRPVTIELLAPNGRPVQTTDDLRSFWSGAYQEVRKELRGRYPKHPWPEDPWTAPATARAKRRR